MPESVKDRPTKNHEYLFLLTKSRKYFYDSEAIKEKSDWPDGPNSPQSIKSPYGQSFTRKNSAYSFARKTNTIGKPNNPDQHRPERNNIEYSGTRNKRSVWTIATQPFKEAHFAVFPEKLIEPCILAGTSEKGCCPDCEKTWKRVVEKKYPEMRKVKTQVPGGQISQGILGENRFDNPIESKTIGWKPGCDCYNTGPLPKYPKQKKDYKYKEIGIPGESDNRGLRPGVLGNEGGITKHESDEDYEKRIEPIRIERLRLLNLWKSLPVIPCTVLDPFGGSGTTAIVANKYNRNFVMIDLSEKYLKDIAIPRIENATRQLKLF